MAYIPGCEYDIFVSYCHNDNVHVPGRDLWVTTFLESVKGVLFSCFGDGVGDLRIFRDEVSFEANHQLPELLAAVKASALFLAICSPNYEARPWTREELKAFYENAGDAERLFAVEKLPLDENLAYPEPLETHNRIRFWQRPAMQGANATSLFPPDPVYFFNVENLVGDIKRKLKLMHANATISIPPETKVVRSSRHAGDDHTRIVNAGKPVITIPQEVIDRAAIQLATHIGPIAWLQVSKVAQLVANEEEFFAILSQSLPNQQDARKFLCAAGQANATTTVRLVPPTSPGSPGARSISPQAVDAARAVLVTYTGPIAKLLISKALADAPSLDTLVDRLVKSVTSPHDAAALRRQLQAVLARES